MTEIPCDLCSHPVESSETECPNCGGNPNKDLYYIAKAVFAIVIAGLITYSVGSVMPGGYIGGVTAAVLLVGWVWWERRQKINEYRTKYA